MREYHRFVNFSSGPSGQSDLEEVLRSAPGASEVTILEMHPKGGYRTQLKLAPEAIDAFFSYLEAAGWRSAF